jgi:flagellar hook-length control protein FliK
VGQTALLDDRADAALQNGSFVLAQQAAGRASPAGWGAQPHVAAGQAVATVAAGVQSALPWVAEGGAAAAVVKVATEAAGLVEDGLQAVADLVQPDTPASEGRVNLLGAWKLEDPQAIPSPTLQRVIGQVEQWAAAGAGLQPKATERAEGSKAGQDAVAGMSAAQGSGTRLTENAVRETQQAQDAQWEAQADVPVEDLRFWLQGKQQRAEVVLDQDGQNVRVQVSVRGNEAHVTFQADQQHTRAVLDNSLAQLREMLEQQGVALAGVSVQAQTSDGQQAGAGAQERGNAWAPQGAARHAQVAVPDAGGSGAQRPRSQGLDVYA